LGKNNWILLRYEFCPIFINEKMRKPAVKMSMRRCGIAGMKRRGIAKVKLMGKTNVI